MSAKKLGDDCCGDIYEVLTNVRCKCGCKLCYCYGCYGQHCIEFFEKKYGKGTRRKTIGLQWT